MSVDFFWHFSLGLTEHFESVSCTKLGDFTIVIFKIVYTFLTISILLVLFYSSLTILQSESESPSVMSDTL